MKKTIKQFELDIDSLKKQRDDELRARWQTEAELSEARKALKSEQEARATDFWNVLSVEKEKTRMLFEIVRWFANPEVAKDPFNDMERRRNNLGPMNS